MTRERHGFTLIELLVVIAIIAILAAILFPVFAKARAKARQTACMSNLKQLGLGFEMYAQDFDEFLPIWGYGDSSEPERGDKAEHGLENALPVADEQQQGAGGKR